MAAVLTEYEDVYSDSRDMDLHIWRPDTFVPGAPVKWVVYLHGHYSVSPGHSAADAAPLADACAATGMVLVAATSDDPDEGSWWDEPGQPARLDELLVAAKARCPELRTYLPCLTGFSIGGGKVVHEMSNRAWAYSAFAASAPLADAIAWGFPSGGYPFTDSAKNAEYEHNTMRLYIGRAQELYGRKLWLKHGTADGNVPKAQSDTLWAAVPEGNRQSYDITSDGHVDLFLDTEAHRSAVVAWMASEARLAEPSLRMTVRTSKSAVADGPSRVMRTTTKTLRCVSSAGVILETLLIAAGTVYSLTVRATAGAIAGLVRRTFRPPFSLRLSAPDGYSLRVQAVDDDETTLEISGS
jgi:hypothetical protein